MNKKILIFSALGRWGMGKGKGAPSLHATLKGYSDAGWEVVFITGGENASETAGSGSPPTAEIPGLKVVRTVSWPLYFSCANRYLSFLASKIGWLVFILSSFIMGVIIVRRFKPDLCYGYEVHGVPAAYLVARLFGLPCVSRFQGTVVPVRVSLFRLLVVYSEHFLACKLPIDLVIMADDGTHGDQVLANLGVLPDRTVFWMNGVEKDRFRAGSETTDVRKMFDLPDAAHVLLTMCRLAGWKRIDRGIRAMPAILDRLPDTYYLVVGGGAMRETWEKLAEELGVKHRVVFAGAVKRENLPNYVVETDVFMSLNDLSNVGNPLLEAMSAGKCVVAVDVGDTNKVVQDGVTGVLVKPDNIDSLPDVLAGLLEDKANRERLGKAAAAYAETHFLTWPQRMAKEVETIESRFR